MITAAQAVIFFRPPQSTPARRRSHADDHTHWNPRRTRRYRSSAPRQTQRFAHGSNIAKCSGWRRRAALANETAAQKPHWLNGAMRYWPSFRARCRAGGTTRSCASRRAIVWRTTPTFSRSSGVGGRRVTTTNAGAHARLAATQCSADAAIAAVQALDAAPAPAPGYGPQPGRPRHCRCAIRWGPSARRSDAPSKRHATKAKANTRPTANTRRACTRSSSSHC